MSKPLYQGQIDELRRLIRDLETRLKNEREQLGHREVFSIGRRGEVPAPLAADRGRVLGVDGWFTLTGSGGGLSTVYVDNVTIGGDGSATYPLSATLLSGTINSAIVSLSATLDSAIQAIGTATPDGATLSAVTGVLTALPLSGTIDARFKNLSGSIDGHFNALSGTVNSAIAAIVSGSQAWTQTANGTEGTTLVASLPNPFPSADYYAFVTNFSGTYSPAFKIDNKTTTTFHVISTSAFVAGDRIDLLAISASFGPVADGTAISNLSGTINSAIVHLSSTLGGSSVGSHVFQGPGIDGALVFDGTSTVAGLTPSGGNYTMGRDLIPTDMTVNVGVIVYTNGWMISCTGTLTVNGTIDDSGTDGTTGGAAGSGRSGTSKRFGGGSNGGGNSGGASGVSSNSTQTGWSTSSSTALGGSVGGAGSDGNVPFRGGGGGGGESGNGGNGGAITNLAASSVSTTLYETMNGRSERSATQFTFGSGGGGAGALNAAARGTGGGGGGIIVILCKTLTGTGSILANGGNGGAGGLSSTYGGGGGGGGGGVVWIVYGTRAGSLTITANGGTGGAAGGPGAGAGGNGANGHVILTNHSGDGT